MKKRMIFYGIVLVLLLAGYVSMNPAQLLWSANSEYWPMTPLGIITSYISGKGKTSAWLWGWVSAFENSGLQMKACLMLRRPGEALWYPTALLPGEEIRWESVASKLSETENARVIFESGMMRVSDIFTFIKSTGVPLMFVAEDGRCRSSTSINFTVPIQTGSDLVIISCPPV